MFQIKINHCLNGSSFILAEKIRICSCTVGKKVASKKKKRILDDVQPEIHTNFDSPINCTFSTQYSVMRGRPLDLWFTVIRPTLSQWLHASKTMSNIQNECQQICLTFVWRTFGEWQSALHIPYLCVWRRSRRSK